jgi:hypothetical protein
MTESQFLATRPPSPIVARIVPKLLVVGIIAGFYVMSLEPKLPDDEAAALAARFRFQPAPFPEISGLSHKSVREVHPSLRHIAGMISFVGAAVALGDLDGDGLPNDLIHVDPRTDQVTVAPVPTADGEPSRFAPFLLIPSPLEFDPAIMAPVGCLIGDFNEDGLSDILVYYWGRSPILFLRKDGGGSPARDQFASAELVAQPARWYTGAVTQADFDGDGHVDLIVGNYFPDDARVLDARGTGTEQMPDSISRAFNGGRKRLFLWQSAATGADPGVRYQIAEGALPGDVVTQWTFGFAAADLDGDLLPELYCVHDWGQDRLLHNRSQPGEPHFAVVAGQRSITTPRSKALGYDTFSGMGVDVGDLNGDGRPDLFVSNITANWGLHESNFAFMSTGQIERLREGVAPYRDESEDWGLSRGGWTWEARLGDFDNDGVLEAMQAAGYLKGTINRWPELQEAALGNDRLVRFPWVWSSMASGDYINGADRNPFFVRASSGRYFDIAERIGIPAGTISRGIATADVDGDGRLDFAVANQWGPSHFYRNMAPQPGAFLGLDLRLPIGDGSGESATVLRGRVQPAIPSRPAIGAHARIHLPDGRVLAAEVDGGTGHSGKRSPDLHFGLGEVDPAAELGVELDWRGSDGRVRSRRMDLTPGWHTVVLGNGTPAPEGGNR